MNLLREPSLSRKPETRLQTKPVAGKGQSQGEISAFEGTDHFARQVLRTRSTRCSQNRSSPRQSAHCVLGSALCAFLCSFLSKAAQQPCEQGVEGCRDSFAPEGNWTPEQVKVLPGPHG